jgi:voltage-gated potassium channel
MDNILERVEIISKKDRKKVKTFLSFRKIFLVILLAVFAASVSVHVSHGENFWEAAYWTACSLTWSHCENDVLYTDAVKFMSIVNGLTAEGILLVLLWTVSERILGIDLGVRRMKRKIDTMKNHFIVCGYGRVGEKVSEILEQNRIEFIVIEKRKDLADQLKENGTPVIEGDSLNPRTLEKAGIGRARGLVSTLGADSDNIFLSLTAKELNPNIMVAARAHSESVVSKLHKAGATIVVLPEIVGGLELGREILQLQETHKSKLISRSNHTKKGESVF